MYTRSLKSSEVKKSWFIIDASGLVIGRLASYIVSLLKGKKNPMYTPHIDCGDNVVVINADLAVLTGSKMRSKVYYRHTGYIGGLKLDTPSSLLASGKGARILRHAVKGMLGSGVLARRRFSNLYVYSGPTHKHMGQKPVPLDFMSMNRKNGG